MSPTDIFLLSLSLCALFFTLFVAWPWRQPLAPVKPPPRPRLELELHCTYCGRACPSWFLERLGSAGMLGDAGVICGTCSLAWPRPEPGEAREVYDVRLRAWRDERARRTPS